MKNTDPFAPYNDPMYKDDPFAPHNDPMYKDDPFKPWNDPFGSSDDLTDREKKYYNIPVKSYNRDAEDERW
jgi:hypothetical protein